MSYMIITQAGHLHANTRIISCLHDDKPTNLFINANIMKPSADDGHSGLIVDVSCWLRPENFDDLLRLTTFERSML